MFKQVTSFTDRGINRTTYGKDENPESLEQKKRKGQYVSAEATTGPQQSMFTM